MPTGARVSKFLKLPLALLAALAVLLLWSGPASAGDNPVGAITEPIVPVLDETLSQVVPDAAQQPSTPDEAPAADVALPQIAQTPALPALPEGSLPAQDLPVVGDVLGGEQGEQGDEVSGDETVDPAAELDPAAVAAECQALLDQAGLSDGGDTCAAIVGCFDRLPAPTDALTLDDAALEELLTTGTPEEIEAALGSLFDPAALTGFLDCLGSALGVTPPEQPTGEQPVTSPAAETYYANCDDARARGAAPVLAGAPGYRAGLDSDDDGIGCEDAEATIQTVTLTAPAAAAGGAGKLAYTGFELTSMLATAGALLALGGTVLVAARRRS